MQRDGNPRYVTALGETDTPGGWRENKIDGGILIDVESNETISRGLSMPHSPRWHQNRWWFCNSGHGSLCTWDAQGGPVEEVCSLPGFVRGLCLVGNFALVGLPRIRKEHILDSPPVRKRQTRLYAGVALVDLRTGNMVGSLEFLRGGSEVFDVALLPGVRHPTWQTE